MKLSNIIKNKLRWLRRHALAALGRDLVIRKDISIQSELHGSDYGGWVIQKDSLDQNSIVLSVGIGHDISFDESLIRKYGCRVHGFDPDPRARAWFSGKNLPELFEWHSVGWAASTGSVAFHQPKRDDWISGTIVDGTKGHRSDSIVVPVRRASDVITQFSIEIDVVKIDIEGAEYEVVQDLIATGEIKKIRQFLVEFHHQNGRYSIDDTVGAVAAIRASGFAVAYVSPMGREVLFLRTSK